MKKIQEKNKILIVTETPPGTPNGFGVTLHNLFKTIDHDVIYTDPSFKTEAKGKGYTFAHCPYHHSKKAVLLFCLGLIPEWSNKYSIIWYFLFLRKKYKIVYTFFYSLETLKFSKWIASKKKAKHIVHIADHCDSFFKDSTFNKIIKHSSNRACIGINMQEAYQKKFNIRFEVFHNFADSTQLPLKPLSILKFNQDNPIKLLFIGSIFQSLHHGAIQDICSVVRELNSLGKPISLNFYGQVQPPGYLENEIDDVSILHHGKIDASDRFKVMQKHHVFIVPATFDKALSSNYCFSIPTKLPELLASGRPTVVYGPHCMEAYRYCKNLDSGILVDKNDMVLLKRIFNHLLEHYDIESKKAQFNVSKSSSELFGIRSKTEFSGFLLN